MIVPLSLLLLTSVVARPLASPVWTAARREVTALDQAATAEAQQRDNTATRAFTAQEIQTSDGQCLAVDPLSGDFRENLTPVQIVSCNGTDGQKWDVITSGKHNNVPGQALIVSSLTNACLNFDPRRAAGNQVILFSCGGRADGGGQVTNSQLFAFNGFNGPFHLQVNNSAGTCMTTAKGALLDQATCDNSAAQTFTIGGAEGGGAQVQVPPSNAEAAASASAVCGAPPTSVESTVAATSSVVASVSSAAAVSSAARTTTASTTAQTTSTIELNTVGNAAAAIAAAASSAARATTASTTTVATTTAAVASSTTNGGSASQFNPSATISVSGAGGVLNPTAAAEANPRDNTATRAFSSVSLKSSDGRCLFIDPTAGDFRENLIPVQLKTCDGSDNEKFDIITAGAHDNVPNSSLVVSSLTQGCLNFDPRRAAGNTVIMFSCGGRADGGGQTTNSQLFPLPVGQSILLAPQNGNNATCLVPNGSLLDESNCTGNQNQVFTIA